MKSMIGFNKFSIVYIFVLAFLSSFFPAPFRFFDLAFYCLFSFFDLIFYRPLFSRPFFFALVLSLFFWLMWFISSLPQLAWE
jgi:hypothetical protein